MKTLKTALPAVVLAHFVALPSQAAVSTASQTRVTKSSATTIVCTYPASAPLLQGSVSVALSSAGKPVSDAKVKLSLVAPSGKVLQLVRPRVVAGVYSTEADIDAPGIYRLIANVERGGRTEEETFEWTAARFIAPRVSPAELRRLVSAKEAVIVDVRAEPAQYIRGAIVIPLYQWESGTAALPKDKLIATYCSCESEHSAAIMTQLLIGKGYRSAAIYGGLDALREAGWPVETALLTKR